MDVLDLHECDRCGSDLCQPVDWESYPPAPGCVQMRWRIVIECPSCRYERRGMFTLADVEAFDVELDRGAERLIANLRELTHANLSEEIEVFCAALDADALLPEDFGP